MLNLTPCKQADHNSTEMHYLTYFLFSVVSYPCLYPVWEVVTRIVTMIGQVTKGDLAWRRHLLGEFS